MLTDFHAHILPGVDDGSASLEESLELLRSLAEQGVTRVVATPHFYPRYDAPEVFLERRARALAQLEEAARPLGLPQVVLGAEVYYFPGISESEILPRLALHGGRCILVEMPGLPWGEPMFRELEAIYHQWGLTPVIAHIDRYIEPFRSRKLLQRLERLPVMIQANGEFFLNKNTRRMALGMLRRGQIHLLGSDCHNLTSRKPDLGAAIAQIRSRLGQEVLAWVEENAAWALRESDQS